MASGSSSSDSGAGVLAGLRGIVGGSADIVYGSDELSLTE